MIQALLLALIVGTPPTAASPAPTGSAAPQLRTIVTVKSSPLCNALAEHFNNAFVPMLANDRVFTVVGGQLDDLDTVFTTPDYVNRFLNLRTKLIHEVAVVQASLPPMQAQIDQLRQSATLTTDPKAAQAMRDSAAQLQDAYKHQFQLATDLYTLGQNMLQYDITRGDHPLGGWTDALNTMPEDEKKTKVWLHFDQQQKAIDGAETSAVDIAYQLAQDSCTK